VVTEYTFEITDIVPDIDWTVHMTMKSGPAIIRMARIRKWVLDEVGTDLGWDLDFEWNPNALGMNIFVIFSDDMLATYFKLKWML
jgi:hypothetical protein